MGEEDVRANACPLSSKCICSSSRSILGLELEQNCEVEESSCIRNVCGTDDNIGLAKHHGCDHVTSSSAWKWPPGGKWTIERAGLSTDENQHKFVTAAMGSVTISSAHKTEQDKRESSKFEPNTLTC